MVLGGVVSPAAPQLASGVEPESKSTSAWVAAVVLDEQRPILVTPFAPSAGREGRRLHAEVSPS